MSDPTLPNVIPKCILKGCQRCVPASQRAEALHPLRALHGALDDGSDIAELHALRAFLA